MPNRDRTGPEGKGPRTGRGMGRCGSGQVDNQDSRPRNGQGRGMGRGRGIGNA